MVTPTSSISLFAQQPDRPYQVLLLFGQDRYTEQHWYCSTLEAAFILAEQKGKNWHGLTTEDLNQATIQRWCPWTKVYEPYAYALNFTQEGHWSWSTLDGTVLESVVAFEQEEIKAYVARHQLKLFFYSSKEDVYKPLVS